MSRFWIASALVVVLASCGDSDSPEGKSSSAATAAARPICGYSASAGESMPDEVAQMLPGKPVMLSSESLADGGSRVVALVEFPLKQAFADIIGRAEAGGWTLEDREQETSDAELELAREPQRLSLALSRPKITGCSATRVEALFSPQE